MCWGARFFWRLQRDIVYPCASFYLLAPREGSPLDQGQVGGNKPPEGRSLERALASWASLKAPSHLL